MRGLAMTTEPETGSVTMLRKPSTPPTEPAATTPPAATPQATPTTAPLPEPGKTATQSKALRAGLVLVAAAGIGAATVYVTSSHSTVPHAPPVAQIAAASGATGNSSGITPPDLGMPPASPAKQATANAQTVTPAGTDKPPVPTSTSVTQPPQSLDAPSAPATSEKAMPDAQADHPAPTATTTAEDQLFMEMSHKLTEMASRIDTLEQQFDASQRALHDQLVSGLGTVGGRLDELRHREDTLEATQSVHAVSSPAAAANVTVSTPATATPTPTPARNNTHKSAETASTHHTPSDAQPAEHPAPRPHYTVQAGAPDIAILESPLGQPVRVQPGSVLDGWGTVTAVTQSGSSWVVHTEHGTIR